MKLTGFSTSLLFVPFICSEAAAGGFTLDQQNAAALGAAYAGAQATRGDVGFAAYNPAALSDIEGFQLSASVTGVFPNSTYENASGTLLGAFPLSGANSGDGIVQNAFVPNLSFGTRLNEKLSVGIVINAPFGLSTEYDPADAVRYHALDTDLKTITATPIAALKLTDQISLGGGIRIQYLDFDVSNAVDAAGILVANGTMGITPGTDDVIAQASGDDVAIGFQFGVLGNLTPNTHVGLNYTSKIDHDISGDANFGIASSPAGQGLNAGFGLFQPTGFESVISTPASVSAGINHDVSEAIQLKASANYTFWESFDVLSLTFDNPAQPPEVLSQNWENSWTASVGAEIALSSNLTARAGFQFDETPVNDEFASPRIPDANRYWLTAGFSVDMSDQLGVDVGVGYAFLEDRPIRQSPALAENLFRGGLSADNDTNAFVASLRLIYRGR